jgi:hypothetical protein
VHPNIEGSLLPADGVFRMVFELEAHVAVHALVRAVVLRMRGPAELNFNAERDPPG